MFRSIRCLHRHRTDGGLVSASAHVVANHLAPRGRPGGGKLQRLFPKGTPDVITGYFADWGSLYFPTDQEFWGYGLRRRSGANGINSGPGIVKHAP
jgi:hypothetical protein